MYIINLTSPYAMLGALVYTLFFIILGKKIKKSILPAIALFTFLILISVHTVQLTMLVDTIHRSIVISSMTVDSVMLLLSYISYLWVDDIEAKAKNKKSIDNSLDWFWKKI